MGRHSALIFCCILLLLGKGNAQLRVSGRIYAGDTDTTLADVSIINTLSKTKSRSGGDGRYSIDAKEGDTLIFSAVGYSPDTVALAFYMLQLPLDINLAPKPLVLQEIRVSTRSYQADSLARRNYYSHIWDKRNSGLTGGHTPGGFGISLSPLSFFSRESKQKRQLKKRLAKYEEDAFIDQSFPMGWVQRITGLREDSLRLFMYRYRPSYSFCRKTDELGMIVYINDKLKEFRKGSAGK
ncbi:MAG TPA: hypothetical protein VFX58_11660 [Chitinophagaceae bacterium]|nr:hypothetical protein [Chitinophagaceae bacterium]